MAEVTTEMNSRNPINYNFYILSCKKEVLSIALKKKKTLFKSTKTCITDFNSKTTKLVKTMYSHGTNNKRTKSKS